jgi:K+-sensing histidine kinase KdpD
VARRFTEIDGEGVAWGGAGFAASILVGIGLRPFRQTLGLENVAIVYLMVVAMAAIVGGRAAGFISALSAALAYNFFFTTPYETLRIDSWGQVFTVVLLFVAGLLASLSGRAGRRATATAQEEAAAIRALAAINLAAARGEDADRVAAERLRELLGARSVWVLRAGPAGDRVTAQAGAPDEELDPAGVLLLDADGRIPPGHHRSVGGTLVLPAGGAAVELVRRRRRVGSLVVVPQEDRPVLRATRTAIAATAHVLALVAGGRP